MYFKHGRYVPGGGAAAPSPKKFGQKGVLVLAT